MRTERPVRPNFQCYQRRRRGRIYYEIPAAPDLEPVEVTGLNIGAAGYRLADCLAAHFAIEPGSFSITLN